LSKHCFDEKVAEMAARTQSLPRVYIWEIPEKPIAVHFNLAIIDDLMAEVMRGFTTVPKRGAEVGGVLLGAIEPGDPGGQTIVRVESFEMVACVYARGPSYLLSSEDRPAFEQACERWTTMAAEQRQRLSPVGYFRSHTRSGLALGSEDIELLDRYFSNPRNIALLIRPWAGKPAEAGFFFREEGAFSRESPRPFVFSRLEMTWQTPAPSSPARAEKPDSPAPRGSTSVAPRRLPHRDERFDSRVDETPAATEPPVKHAPPAANSTWIWIPLSIVFSLVSAVIGFQISQRMSTGIAAGDPAEFSLALRVIPAGHNLAVQWNPGAPAVRTAQSGRLEIQDGRNSSQVDLDSGHLQKGSILYPNSSPAVRFRLIVYESGGVTVTETVDWPQ
jgi:hypothetical protein